MALNYVLINLKKASENRVLIWYENQKYQR